MAATIGKVPTSRGTPPAAACTHHQPVPSRPRLSPQHAASATSAQHGTVLTRHQLSSLWPGQLAAGSRRTRQWAVAAHPRDLWSYEGSCVQEMNLETMQALHRLSYGHRNPRSMLVVVYDPQDPVCKDAELEVERLATGLRRYPHVVIAKFNVRTAHQGGSGGQGNDKEGTARTAKFLASVTDVSRLPAVVLYPEGTPGLLRYNVSGPLIAESLLAALNSCQSTVFPNRPLMQLSKRAAAPAAAAAAAAPAAQPAATAAVAAAPSRWWSEGAGYWSTPGKTMFWAGVVLISVLTIVWEKWLGPYLELRAFNARQAMRAADPDRAAELYDEDTNIEDLFRARTLAGRPPLPARSSAAAAGGGAVVGPEAAAAGAAGAAATAAATAGAAETGQTATTPSTSEVNRGSSDATWPLLPGSQPQQQPQPQQQQQQLTSTSSASDSRRGESPSSQAGHKGTNGSGHRPQSGHTSSNGNGYMDDTRDRNVVSVPDVTTGKST